MNSVQAPTKKSVTRFPLPALTLLMVLPAPTLGASAAGTAVDTLRVGSYDIDAAFEPSQSSMVAHAHINFAAPVSGEERLVFYLHNELVVDSVSLEGHPASFTSEEVDYYLNYSTKALRTEVPVPSGSPIRTLSVFYSGHVRPSDARSPSDYMRIDSDGVFLRSYGYSLWFPIFLESQQTSYAVSFPRVLLRTPMEYRSVFVGSMVSEYEEGGRRISEWKVGDVDLLHVQCTAQRFEVTSSGQIHAYHGSSEASRAAAADILSFTDELTQEYRRTYGPGSSDGQTHLMEMPKYGMIASGNVSGLPTDLWQAFQEQEGFRMGLAHELVHQFVFVPVELSDPLWPFAIEGFPSYFYLSSLGKLTGEEHYQAQLARVEASYLRKRETVGSEGSHLPPEVPLLEIPYQNFSQYKDTFVLSDRALLFLNFLRTRMGSEGFDRFTVDLFNRDRLDLPTFRQIVADHLPESEDVVRVWLETTEYPPELRLQGGNGG